MKKLLLISLLSSIFLFASAQYKTIQPVKKKIPESAKVIAAYSTSIILNAVGDGLNDNGNKGWGHACNAASVGVLLTSPFILDYDRAKFGWYIASYVCLRISLFDYSYNTTRGLPVNYIGGTSFWDRGLKSLNPPNTYLLRSVFFTVGISIPIKKLK